MKRSFFVTLLVLIVLSLAFSACAKTPATQAPAAYPSTGQNPATTGGAYPAGTVKMVVATDATFPPFETVDEATKELTGFDMELIRAVAAKAGIQLELVNLPFDPMLAGVVNCQYDGAIAAITITDERKAQMTFSDPYINAGQIVVVATSNNTINGKADLTGKTLGAQLGTTGEIEAKKIDGVTYKPYDTYDLAFLDLANGQIDAVIADYPTALGFIGKNPQLKYVGEVFTDESYGIAVCKTKADQFVPLLNKALADLKADGTIKALETKWLAAQ